MTIWIAVRNKHRDSTLELSYNFYSWKMIKSSVVEAVSYSLNTHCLFLRTNLDNISQPPLCTGVVIWLSSGDWNVSRYDASRRFIGSHGWHVPLPSCHPLGEDNARAHPREDPNPQPEVWGSSQPSLTEINHPPISARDIMYVLGNRRDLVLGCYTAQTDWYTSYNTKQFHNMSPCSA